MLAVEESIVIARPRAEVWDFLTDPENVTVYASNIVEYEMVEGDKHTVGRRCRGAAKVAGRRVEFTDEMRESEPAAHTRLVSEDATIPYSLDLSYAEEDGGTRVTWHQEVESLKGIFKFADPIVMRLYARDVRANLENAKTILES
jgi:carbon monoxide dehydrogenase subunit G